MLKRIITYCTITTLFLCEINAQSYNILKLGVREGMLHSLVTGITQDKRGDIWMSTGGGLCKYNGFEFEYITSRDGLNFTRLTCVAADDEDNIWVGSSKGLNFIQGKIVLSVNDPNLGSEIQFISPAEKSMVWVVANNGLYKVGYNNGSFDVSKIAIPQFHSSEMTQIFQDRVLSTFIFRTKKGNVFYGNSGKLFRINNQKVEEIETKTNLSVNTALELFDSSVLFGTNKGIYKLEGLSIVPFTNPKDLPIDIKHLGYDGDNLWILGKETNASSTENCLFAIDLNYPKVLREIGKKNGLTDEPTQLFIDHEGSIWTTSNNGVSILKGNAFVAYTTEDGMIGNKAWGIYRTTDGALWVGTIGEGLTIIKNNKFVKFNTFNGLTDNYIAKIYQTKSGKIYLGTGNAGICRAFLNKNSGKYEFSRIPFPDQNRVRVDDIIEDNNGVLWVASSKGLFFSNNQKEFSQLPLTKNDTGQVFVQKLLLDSIRNTMWIGTRYNGVFTLQNNSLKQFDRINSTEEISSLALDNLGDIWIGTRNNGVFRYDGNNIIQITEKQGLASNLVYILHPDKLHNLWIGTNLGLNRIDLKQLKHDGKPTLRRYGPDEGLVDLEMNLNGILEDDDKGFWISTNGGLLRYERNADKTNSIPPKVRIVNLKLNSQDTDWSNFDNNIDPWSGLPQKLTLKHYQNHLTFEFVGISFKNPKLVKYEWKLDGFDKNWVTSTSRQAIYSNIPPGNYVFKLKAANNDLVWSDEVHSMPFTVRPPFWITWWFRLSVVLAILLLVYLYVINRIKSLKTKQKELKNLVDIRTLELREQFKIADEQNKKILDSLKYAKFLQNAMLTSIDEISSNFSDAFVYYKPKDIVSGDFYWYTRYNNTSVFAVADCTGHGVPGAIISVICENALRQAVMANYYENPAKILIQTNKYVIDTFTQTHKEVHHGMEIALCSFNHNTNELTFSGAKLGMYIVKDGELIKLKPSIHRIGWDLGEPVFKNETLVLEKGNLLYLFTDGYGDQFEPKNRKKFSTSRLKEILYKSTSLPSCEVYSILNHEFEAWKGEYEQIDDVLVVGIRI